MKKYFGILAIMAAMFVVSCGPSAKELNDKRIADSIRTADSICMVQAETQRVADSIAAAAKADSTAKAQTKVTVKKHK